MINQGVGQPTTTADGHGTSGHVQPSPERLTDDIIDTGVVGVIIDTGVVGVRAGGQHGVRFRIETNRNDLCPGYTHRSPTAAAPQRRSAVACRGLIRGARLPDPPRT